MPLDSALPMLLSNRRRFTFYLASSGRIGSPYGHELLLHTPTPSNHPFVWSPTGAWVYPEYAGLVAGYVGLYQINVTVPAQLPPSASLNGFATMRIRRSERGSIPDLLMASPSAEFASRCLRK